jgi:translation initiation factor IF-2
LDRLPRPVPEDTSAFPTRPPVVAIMGHIDHGKTTLLDNIRSSRVAAQEHGGITQKMAAFSVHVESVGSDITFIDTPGHAAFETMRKRGASATDICILVVAADDGVQEQTLEAIKHINEAECGMIVAINKVDKKGADVARTKRQLIAAGIQFEDGGGDVPLVEISGLKGTGVDKLLETIAIWAGDMDLRADKAGEAEAAIMDTRRDDWRGLTASVITRIGTLKVGDAFVAGYTYGEVKALIENGKSIKEAIPGQPVDVYGFEGNPPEPGDDLMVVVDVETAEKIARYRFDADNLTEGEQEKIKRVKEEMDERERALQDRLKAIELGEDPDEYVEAQRRKREALKPKEVPVFVNTDVGGSLEAVQEALARFADNEVKIRVVRAVVGPITELEIQEAAFAEPKAVIVGFNVPLSSKLQEDAKKIGVLVNSFKIIYGLTDWVRLVLSKLLKPDTETTVTSEAEVLQIFSVTQRKKVYNVAGCIVRTGTFKRGKRIQLLRAGNLVWEGPIRNLKHVKQDVNAVQAGKECGILLDEEVTDIQVGDVIRTIEQKQVSREIEVTESKDNSQAGVLRM